MLNKKRLLILWIDQLNKHYGMSVSYQGNRNKPIKFFMSGNKINAGADIPTQTIYIPYQYPAMVDKRVVAHEYAHLMSEPRQDMHDKKFKETYKECCLVLGVFYTPTNEMRREIISKLPEGSVPNSGVK